MTWVYCKKNPQKMPNTKTEMIPFKIISGPQISQTETILMIHIVQKLKKNKFKMKFPKENV